MTKKNKFLLVLVGVIFLIFLYLVITSELATVEFVNEISDKQIKDINVVSADELRDNYKEGTRGILSQYLKIISGDEITVEQIENIRNQLLDLKVPTEFKDLHLNLVLALTKMETYLEKGDIDEKINSQQLISQAKANYKWLSE